MQTTTRTFDPNIAFILELVLGIFGLLGIGYLYGGRTDEGVVRLVVWLIWNLVAWCSIILLMAVIIGFCLIPFALAIQVGVPVWSAYSLKQKLVAQGLWTAA